jgi:hypothetical protein
MTSVFQRGPGLSNAVSAEGCWVVDSNGRRYLDGAAGALVVNVGHRDRVVIEAAQHQLDVLSYVHPSAFGSDVSERYGRELASRLPMDDPVVFPVSGGSEAVETALKVARAYHLARGEPERSVVVGRELSYHGNTRGALDVSGRASLRGPYLPWLGLSGRVPGVLEYRCPNPQHPEACASWHAARLDEEIQRIGPGRVAAFVAEPVGGAASGAAVPPVGYWASVSEVCARHGVLVIADEVMTGFGRTGRWFASEHFGLRPDVMTMAKGASSGYWPLGVCAFSGEIAAALRQTGLIHGFTFSHHIVGAAVGLAVLERIEQLALVGGAAQKGKLLLDRLSGSIGGHRFVGDIRGIGLMLAVELVADRATKTPFPRSASMAERLTALAKEEGLLLYPSSGCAGGDEGDLVMIGPPLTIDDEEIEMLVSKLAAALGRLG